MFEQKIAKNAKKAQHDERWRGFSEDALVNCCRVLAL
jgi:hypothetical protein